MSSRQWNTNRKGKDFTNEEQQRVWEKGQILDGYDENKVRSDLCGAIIHKEDFANTSSHYGWEIDHIKPVSEGGGDEIENLQPLQWRNNRSKGNDFPTKPKEYCRVNSKRS